MSNITKTTKVYVHGSKESMYDEGVKLGLSGEALHYFTFTGCEVELEILVDMNTGDSTIIAVDGKPVSQKGE